MALIIFLITISILVVVHELGHFIVARIFGVRVEEFGLGYPPRVCHLFSYKGTNFTLNWIPIGGFVKIENESSEFRDQNRAVQVAVLAGGVLFNLIFASLLLALVYGVGAGFDTMIIWTKETVVALGMFLSSIAHGSVSWASVSGPVGLVNYVGQVAQYGWKGIMEFTAIISINLAVINLLPIPALDGGRILFVLVESITRRKVPETVFNLVNNAGFLALMLLMVVVTFHDVKIWVK